jgi:hypothetical protein
MARLMDVSESTAFYWGRNGVRGGPEGLLIALLAKGKIKPNDLWELRLEFERITAEQCAKQGPVSAVSVPASSA